MRANMKHTLIISFITLVVLLSNVLSFPVEDNIKEAKQQEDGVVNDTDEGSPSAVDELPNNEMDESESRILRQIQSAQAIAVNNNSGNGLLSLLGGSGITSLLSSILGILNGGGLLGILGSIVTALLGVISSLLTGLGLGGALG